MLSTKPRRFAPVPAATSVLAAVLGFGLLGAPAADGAVSRGEDGGPALSEPIKKGLDNPRQLTLLRDGRVVVAEAGHGSYQEDNCFGPEGPCIGLTGKVGVLRPDGTYDRVMRRLLSIAGTDGSFAVGSDGAGKRPGGRYQAVITSAPPDLFPEGAPGRREAGKLLARAPEGRNEVLANISRFEARHDPDGEGVESNPYSMLALRNQTLVADAAGDYIASVKGGKVSLWATLPEYGKRVDAVPTVISRGGDGKVYVGELHSEQPGQARVWKYDRSGDRLRSWGGFTTISGVARTKDGTLYVSELFGQCPEEDCSTPGRVVRVAPDGTRTSIGVPFPAGVVARGNRVLVAAYSTAPAKGFGGDRAASGQIWRLHGFHS